MCLLAPLCALGTAAALSVFRLSLRRCPSRWHLTPSSFAVGKDGYAIKSVAVYPAQARGLQHYFETRATKRPLQQVTEIGVTFKTIVTLGA